MKSYQYLIVGGGMTAAAAVDAIRSVDQEGSIGLISKESHPPYARPPLTKALWKGRPVEKIWRKTDERGADLILDRSVVSIDPQAKRVRDDRGEEYGYDKLLLATGGTPRQLPFGEGNILYYRTFDDYLNLRQQANQPRQFGVIGGGFIGSEIAAALRMQGEDVVMLFPEAGIGARTFPPDLSEVVTTYYMDKGVQVLPGETLNNVERQDGKTVLETKSGQEIPVDFVVGGVGIRPNTELAEATGIRVDDGILVDDYLRTNQPDIYAAGDVARFYNPSLDKRLRVEHEDNANTMGWTAGLNMAGQETPYHHLPFFYSDLFELGYEAVGELDPRLETVSDWQEPYRKGVIYYLKDGRVRGVLLWNVWNKVDEARKLIAEPGPFRAEDLRGRIQ